MPQFVTPAVESCLVLLRETFEGASGASTYFIDNDPGAGFLGTVDGLSAQEASRRARRGGSSIAGHVFHVGFHLEMSSAWLRGDREPRDWRQSWTVTVVDEAGWGKLRASLRRQFADLVRAIETEPAAGGDALATTIGAIAHAAYHLGAIRQRISMAKDP